LLFESLEAREIGMFGAEAAALHQQLFSLLDKPSESELLFMAEQVNAADVLQIQAHQVRS